MADLALVNRLEAPTVTPDQLDLIKRTVANGASDTELKLYLYDCQRQGVHPLDKLLHFTKRGGKYTPVTSIDLMRTRAADTGEYAGSNDAEFAGKPGDPDFAATVTVTRLVQGNFGTFTATARWSEYCPGQGQDHMWRKMPHTMLAKCAEALALRKGFPRQLAGLYAAEEMAQADNGMPRRPDVKADPIPREKPAGFDDWWDDLTGLADTGEAALRTAWEQSAKEYRAYLLETNREGWQALKAKAAEQKDGAA